jgi:hypothetical protein
MGSQTVPTPGREAWALAKRDHDIVSRGELLDLGFHPKAIEHRVQKRRLHPQARGVYSVGSPNLTKYGRWMVAIKSCGPETVLSHLSAAVLWGLWKREPRRVCLAVPRERNPRAAGVRVSRRSLPPRDMTKQHGIPVTTVIRTLIDLATILDRRELEDVINQADAKNLLRADVLRAELDRRVGQPGVPALRAILDRDLFVLSDSDLERLFIPIAREAGLPKPQSRVWVNGWKVDFYWPVLGLIVECDSLRYHRTAFEQRKDRLRDQAHFLAEETPVRYTHWQIAKDRAYVARHLGAVAERLARERSIALSSGTGRRAG